MTQRKSSRAKATVKGLSLLLFQEHLATRIAAEAGKRELLPRLAEQVRPSSLAERLAVSPG